MTDFQSQYESFVQIHGKLFEKETVPMDDVDLKLLRRNDWLYRKVAFPLLLFMGCGGAFGLLYVILEKNLVFSIGFGLSTISCFALALYVRTAYNGLLEKRVKTVVTGIVKDKKKHGSWGNEKYFGLSISGEDKIFGSLDEFKVFVPGDIIRYEKFERERNKNKKPERLGHISNFKRSS